MGEIYPGGDLEHRLEARLGRGRYMGDTWEIQGRYKGDTGEMQGRHRGDTGEIQGRYGGDAGEIWYLRLLGAVEVASTRVEQCAGDEGGRRGEGVDAYLRRCRGGVGEV